MVSPKPKERKMKYPEPKNYYTKREDSMTFEWWLQPITITWLKGMTFIRAELAIYLGILVVACI
jgi:hypothetical protein